MPYRLPTETEWEYAARSADKDIRYPWGNEEYDGSQGNFINSSFPFPWAELPDDPGQRYHNLGFRIARPVK